MDTTLAGHLRGLATLALIVMGLTALALKVIA
jgi:hypothetical protein